MRSLPRKSVIGHRGLVKHRSSASKLLGKLKQKMLNLPTMFSKKEYFINGYTPTQYANTIARRQKKLRNYVMPSVAPYKFKYVINIPYHGNKKSLLRPTGPGRPFSMVNGSHSARLNYGVNNKTQRFAGSKFFTNYHSLGTDPKRGYYGRTKNVWSSGENAHVSVSRGKARISARSPAIAKAVKKQLMQSHKIDERTENILKKTDNLPNEIRRKIFLSRNFRT